MKLTNFLLILCLLTGSLGAFAQSTPSPLRPSKNSLEWADKTLRKMSVDEKIGQLIHVGINARYLHQQSASYRELHRHVTENHIGGIIFFVGPVYETVHLANRMQAAAITAGVIGKLYDNDIRIGRAVTPEDVAHDRLLAVPRVAEDDVEILEASRHRILVLRDRDAIRHAVVARMLDPLPADHVLVGWRPSKRVA